MSSMNTRSKLSVVYDITKQCPWNCNICCMGAISSCEALKGELSLERKLSLMDDLAEVNQTRKFDTPKSPRALRALFF